MAKKNYEHLLPDVSEDINEENLSLFFSSMFERQEIWYKRFILNQPAPWTDDEIFKGKFTNVYRELDRHSQWQIKNVIIGEKDKLNLVWKIMLFRIFNKPELFDFIKDKTGSVMPDYKDYNVDRFGELVGVFREGGENPFTNAYLINSQACPGQSRDWCYINKVIPAIHKSIPKLLLLFRKAEKPEQVIDELLKLPSVAHFIAHEFYQDFTYIKRYSDVDIFKFDQNDYTNVGPGAKVGIRLIFPSLDNNRESEQAIYILKDMAMRELDKIGNFKFIDWDKKNRKYIITSKCNITLHQIEMWLCEFQKYWKMKYKVGKQRSVFQPQSKRL